MGDALLLLGQVNVNSGRPMKPASPKMTTGPETTASCPAYIATLTILPEDIDFPTLPRKFLSDPSSKYLLFLVCSPTFCSPRSFLGYEFLKCLLSHLFGQSLGSNLL